MAVCNQHCNAAGVPNKEITVNCIANAYLGTDPQI